MRSPTLQRERERWLNLPGNGKLSKQQLKRRGKWEDHLKELRDKAVEKVKK